MNKVDVYVESNIKGPRARSGAVAYWMEYTSKIGQKYELSGFLDVPDMTSHESMLFVITRALNRIADGTEIQIYTDDLWAASCINQWIREWRRRGWLTAKGEAVSHEDFMEAIYQKMQHNSISAAAGQHPMSQWQLYELAKGRRGEDERPKKASGRE